MRNIGLAILAALAACSSGQRGHGPAPVSIAPIHSELSRDQQVEHALSRLTFGARPGDAERVRQLGLERWISLQLAPSAIDDHVTDSLVAQYGRLDTQTPDLTMAFRDARAERRAQQQRDSGAARLQPTPQAMESRRLIQQSIGQLGSSKIARATSSERQLYEQMVDFWENHFSVFEGKGQTRLYLLSYDRDVIRPNAMGKFRDLLGAVAKSPAMLFYLDNAQSVADPEHSALRSRPRLQQALQARAGTRRGLNENYARELMELHTLGVDGGYSQHDVIEVARALTGWSIDPREGSFVFRPAAHDVDSKVVLGSTIKGGRGIEDGEQVLDILAKHSSTAKFITRKLAVRFVSDSPSPALVDRCARTFSTSDGDIASTLRCVVTSPEFFSMEAYRAKVKTPFELVVSAFRATQSMPDQTPRTTQIVAKLGQPIFGRQTPDGWPDRGADWMNAGAMVGRTNFGLQLASGRVPGVRVGSVSQAVAALIATPDFQVR